MDQKRTSKVEHASGKLILPHTPKSNRCLIIRDYHQYSSTGTSDQVINTKFMSLRFTDAASH